MPIHAIIRSGGWALATMVLTASWLFLVYVDWGMADVDLALATESLSYCQIWCIAVIELGGFPADLSFIDPIDKVDAVDHIGELLEAA